ncbi:Aluminum-activated malate transporter 12, partial [Cucurbita argyrosperma subsp. sororia]
MGSAVVVSIPEEIQDQRVTDDVPVDQNKNKNKTAAMNKFRNLFDSTRDRIKKQDMKKIFHSIKLGIALVVVSLLYLLNPLYKQVGDNAMWAIMTVIVVFEFYAGATLSKGLNRGLGTIFGGGLGCFAGSFAQDVGGEPVLPLLEFPSLFSVSLGSRKVKGFNSSYLIELVCSLGGIATYLRLIPSIKKEVRLRRDDIDIDV